MGSFPLAALHVNPPQQQPNQLEQLAQVMQMKQQMQAAPLQQQALQQRVQSGQQQLQEGQLNIQQQQQGLKDQQAMTSAMQGWDGKDYNDLVPLVMKNGGSAQAVMGLKAKILEQQQSISTAFKNNSEGAKAQIEAVKTKGDLLNGALSSLVDPKQVPDEQLPQAIVSTAQDLVQKGILDPQHAQQAAQLAQLGDPMKMRQQLDLLRKSNLAQSQIMENAAKQATTAKDLAQTDEIKGKMNPNSPLYAPSAASVALGTAPGAAQIQANEVRQAARKAGAEEGARMPGEMALARQRQALSQGDPSAAGQLLVNGDATLSELKSRGATPDFIAKSLFAARQLSGGKYNAQEAEANFAVAKSPANVQFFGAAKSLTDKGGTLDQLAAAAKDIPGNQLPVFNSLADWEKAASGSGPIAKYATIALGVADDGAKVMGGGVATDSGRTQILQNIGAKLSPAQRAGAIDGMRGSVNSQIKSRIGNNTTLLRMYGGDSGTTANAAPKIGDIKTFPNGKQGKWDGKGYVAQ